MAVKLGIRVLFAASLISALGLTYILARDAAASGGSLTNFEAQLRHYTDTLSFDAGGSLRLTQARHPILSWLSAWAVALAATIASGAFLRRR